MMFYLGYYFPVLEGLLVGIVIGVFLATRILKKSILAAEGAEEWNYINFICWLSLILGGMGFLATILFNIGLPG